MFNMQMRLILIKRAILLMIIYLQGNLSTGRNKYRITRHTDSATTTAPEWALMDSAGPAAILFFHILVDRW